MTRRNPLSAVKIGRMSPLILLAYVLMACAQYDGPNSGAAAHAQENVVRNGDFEAPGGGVPTHWSLDKTLANKGGVSLVDVGGQGSGRTLKLSPNQANASGAQPLGLAQVVPAAGLSGKRLKVSAKLGAQGGAMAVVGVTILDESGGKLGKLHFSQGGNGGRLEAKEGFLEIPNAQAKHLIVFTAVAGAKGAAFIDDIVIEPIDGHGQGADNGDWGAGPASDQSNPSENLLANGGFEAGGGDLPQGWTIQKATAAKGRVAHVRSKQGVSGQALMLSPNQSNTPGGQPLGVAQVLPAAGLSGKELKVSLRLGADGGAMAVAGVTVLGQGGEKVGKLRFSQESNGGRLETKEGILRMPDAEAKHLIVFVTVAGTKGAAYFDDIVIEPVGGDDSDVVVPGPGGSLQAKINIYADEKVRDIPRSLYGTNLNWVDSGNSIFDPRTHKPNATIIDLAKDLNVSLVRFPGGTLGDYYHWRDGVGPQNARPSKPKYGKGKPDRHTVGTDEALDFAQSIGAKLLIVANMGTGTADEAAEWVRYINTDKNRQQQHVTYWEIGNELYFERKSHHLTMEPDEYASRFIDYAKAMKRVDRTIKVGAIGGENFGKYQFVHYPEWNRKVLRRVAKHVDFFAVHNAYAPLLDPHESPDGRSLYAALLAAPINVRQNLELIGSQIEEFTGNHADRIKIAITEWGPYFSPSIDSPYVDHTKTLGSALFVASMLGTFIDMPRVEIANFFKLSEHTFMGWIGPRGFTNPFNGSWIPKAPYYAFQLYTQHFGDVLVRTNTESPSYDSPAVGRVDAVRGVPYLEARASTSRDGQTLYLMVINKHFDQAMETQIRIDGFTPGPNATTHTLHGTALDANTGTELPNWVPGLKWAKQAQVKPLSRFYSRKLGEVKVSSDGVQGVGSDWTYTFPPCSVTAVELRRN